MAMRRALLIWYPFLHGVFGIVGLPLRPCMAMRRALLIWCNENNAKIGVHIYRYDWCAEYYRFKTTIVLYSTTHIQRNDM